MLPVLLLGVAGPRAAAAGAPEPRRLQETAAMALLRSHLLHLLPCEREGEGGQVSLTATVDGDGTLQGLRVLEHSLSPETVRCVLGRVSWWALPHSPQHPLEIALAVRFPLQVPSVHDHAAVIIPGPGRVDAAEVSAALHKARERVLGCFPRAADEGGGPRRVLVSLRLGEFGRVLSSAVEVDTGRRFRPAPPPEQPCVNRALRLQPFPNPSGGEVEVQFPYVIAP